MVNYPAPTTTGGLAPITVTANPPSGSIFPIGTTAVVCNASDSFGQSVIATFNVIVLPNDSPPEVFSASNTLPPQSGMYISPQQWFGLFANGCAVRNVVLQGFQPGYPPPAPGDTRTDNWSSTVTLELTTDNGATWTPHTVPASVQARITGPLSGNSYDTEMLQLDISGGTLPFGLLLRESPAMCSLGRATTRAVAGGFMISSFFDVFTEISTDGGQSWLPAQNCGILESRVDDSIFTPITTPTNLLLPPGDRLLQCSALFAAFPSNIVMTGARVSYPSPSVSPPLSGSWLP